nr:AraC family transcriptional regulator [Micromonospora terminaliae]
MEDVLSLIGATSRLSAALAAGGPWALRFDPPAGVKFNVVRRGTCWLRVDGVADPLRLREGDCFLLTRPVAFTLASDLELPAEPAGPRFAAAVDGVARAGAGDEVFLVGGAFTFSDRAQALLLDGLPPVIHVAAGTPEAAAVRRAVEEIDTELQRNAAGARLVAEHLAIVMLVRILRLYLAGEAGRTSSGWLAGLTDPTVATVLRRMHARPAHPWTVAELARTAAVARSTLAARFKQVVGQGPLEYLTAWRIELAADRIRRGDGTVATIARDVGYGSESAFSVAFKRTIGLSPRAYRAAAATARSD